jgi:hypothetical protein
VDDALAPGIKVAIVLPPEHSIFPRKELDLLLVNSAPYMGAEGGEVGVTYAEVDSSS